MGCEAVAAMRPTEGMADSLPLRLNGFTLRKGTFPRDGRVDWPCAPGPAVWLALSGAFVGESFGARLRVAQGEALFKVGGSPLKVLFQAASNEIVSIEVEPDRLPGLAEDGLPATRLVKPPLEILLKLKSEWSRRDTWSALLLEGCCLQLVAAACRGAAARRREPRGWLSEAKAYLEENFRERIVMRRLAQKLGVHPVSLASAFRQDYGASPGEHLRQLRVRWALDRLLNTDDRLSHIAVDAGFYDQSHMGRAFKRQLGRTPGELRRGGETAARITTSTVRPKASSLPAPRAKLGPDKRARPDPAPGYPHRSPRR